MIGADNPPELRYDEISHNAFGRIILIIRKNEYPQYLQLLKKNPEFKDFTSEEFAVIQNKMRVRSYPKGQLLFNQADPRANFYFLAKGLLKTERTDESGNEFFYEFINETKGFPYRGMFHDHDYSYSVTGMTATEIISIPMADFESLLMKNKKMMRNVILEMGQIINENENQLQLMVNSSASSRVRNGLKVLGQSIGKPGADGTRLIPYPITLIELSQISGTTRETASQVVKELVASGQITYERKYFTLLNN